MVGEAAANVDVLQVCATAVAQEALADSSQVQGISTVWAVERSIQQPMVGEAAANVDVLQVCATAVAQEFFAR
jgi:hypothetical protein